MDTHTNWAQVYRALLHQTSITYWDICTYPVQMDHPTDWAEVYRVLLNQTCRTYWEMRRPSPTNSSPIVQSPTTPNQCNLLRNEAIPSADGHPQLSQSVQSPTDTKPVEPIEKYRHTQCRWTPTLIELKCTEPYYTKPVEPIEKCICTYHSADGSPNWAKVYRPLLHQTSRTYWEIQTYPVQMDTHTNWAQVYRALLHQTSGTYWEICTYPVQMDPPIEPKCTEHYYTKPAETIEKWGGPPC